MAGDRDPARPVPPSRGSGVKDGERFSYRAAAIELAFFAWPFAAAAALML